MSRMWTACCNSLRGGRNTYSSKCRIGNYVEEEFRPDIQRKGFSKVCRTDRRRTVFVVAVLQQSVE